MRTPKRRRRPAAKVGHLRHLSIGKLTPKTNNPKRPKQAQLSAARDVFASLRVPGIVIRIGKIGDLIEVFQEAQTEARRRGLNTGTEVT